MDWINDCNIQRVGDLFNCAATLIDFSYAILLSVAILVLVYGIFKFIVKAGDETARKEGRQFMLWAIIGIFILTSIWGIIGVLQNTLSLNTSTQNVPTNIAPRR